MDLGMKDSFYSYLETVYGEYPGKFIDYKNKLDILYKRSSVNFRFANEYKKFEEIMDFHLSEHAFGFRNIDYMRPQKDNAWVEVQRSSTSCLLNFYLYPFRVETKEKRAVEDTFVEGLGRGWPLDTGFDKRLPKPYGCWFYMLRGSGVFVNVGKTLISFNRSHAYSLLGLPCGGGIHCYDPNDYEVCSKVLEKGYDSLQVFNSHDGRYSELVFCSGKCATDPLKSACPPLELRTGWNATKKCTCNSTYPILNCDNHVTNALDCHNIKPVEYKPKQTCYYEDFTWLNEFRSSPVKIALLFVHNSKDVHMAKIKTLMNTYKKLGHVILIDTGNIDSKITFSHGLIKRFDAMDKVEYDIVPITRDYLQYEEILKIHKQHKFSMLSLSLEGYPRSTIINKGGINIGFISYSLHSMTIHTIIELIIDEVLCLKRWTDMIILISDVEPHIDHIIANKLHHYVDIIIGKQLKSNNCNNTLHTNNDIFVIYSPIDAPIGVISLEILNKTNYNFNTKFIDQESISPDLDVVKWIESQSL
jgi:hypothetical protein